MSTQKGMLVTCDICGATVHLKATDDGVADGGYTRWNQFEDRPEGWRNNIKINNKGFIDTCPKCTAKYDELYARIISELKSEREVQE